MPINTLFSQSSLLIPSSSSSIPSTYHRARFLTSNSCLQDGQAPIGNPRCCQFLPHPRVLYLRSCSGHLLILPLWSVPRTDFVIPPTDESTVLARRGGNTVIPKWEKAVEGISGAAVIYTAFAMILTCFLGGITFFSFLGVVLDILFCGGFIAIAILTDGGRNSCSGVNNSPIGSGEYLSCQLQRVVFIVAIIAALVVSSCQTPSIN